MGRDCGAGSKSSKRAGETKRVTSNNLIIEFWTIKQRQKISWGWSRSRSQIQRRARATRQIQTSWNQR